MILQGRNGVQYRQSQNIFNQGGMGILYEVSLVNVSISYSFLYKTWKTSSDPLENQMHAQRTEREALVLERLEELTKHQTHVDSHPKFQSIIIHENQFRGFIFEKIDGMSIDDWLHKYKPNTREKMYFCLRLLGVVRNLHQNQVIHRDIKPDHFLIIDRTSNYSIRIIDFGLAKMFGDEGKKLGETSVKLLDARAGTAGYTSIEQEQALSKCTYKSDQFSIALVLLYVINGKKPFSERYYDESMWKTFLGSGEFRRTLQNIPTLKKYSYVKRCLFRALEIDSAKRYDTTQDFYTDLERAIQNEIKNPTIKSQKFAVGVYPNNMIVIEWEKVQNKNYEVPRFSHKVQTPYFSIVHNNAALVNKYHSALGFDISIAGKNLQARLEPNGGIWFYPTHDSVPVGSYIDVKTNNSHLYSYRYIVPQTRKLQILQHLPGYEALSDRKIQLKHLQVNDPSLAEVHLIDGNRYLRSVPFRSIRGYLHFYEDNSSIMDSGPILLIVTQTVSHDIIAIYQVSWRPNQQGLAYLQKLSPQNLHIQVSEIHAIIKSQCTQYIIPPICERQIKMLYGYLLSINPHFKMITLKNKKWTNWLAADAMIELTQQYQPHGFSSDEWLILFQNFDFYQLAVEQKHIHLLPLQRQQTRQYDKVVISPFVGVFRNPYIELEYSLQSRNTLDDFIHLQNLRQNKGKKPNVDIFFRSDNKFYHCALFWDNELHCGLWQKEGTHAHFISLLSAVDEFELFRVTKSFFISTQIDYQQETVVKSNQVGTNSFEVELYNPIFYKTCNSCKVFFNYRMTNCQICKAPIFERNEACDETLYVEKEILEPFGRTRERSNATLRPAYSGYLPPFSKNEDIRTSSAVAHPSMLSPIK